MRILSRKKTCKCGCEFEYDKSDVYYSTYYKNTEWYNTFNPFRWPTEVTEYYVKCPNCDRKIWIA